MAPGKQYTKLQDLDTVPKLQNDEEFYYPPSFADRSWPNRYAIFKLPIHHCIFYTLLIISNITCLILWLQSSYNHPNSSKECIRPQLTFCKHIPFSSSLSAIHQSSPHTNNQLAGPAASGSTHYERRRLVRTLENNPYTGPPRPELDAAWGKLLEPMTIFITPDEYQAADLGADTLQLRDGSGYVGEMAVYHELHCIKRIRRHLHIEHYYPNLTDDEKLREDIHMDHCLEYWREAAMCRGDPTLATMFWRDALPTSRVWSDHECVNWEALDGWARSRMLKMEHPEILNQTYRYDWISLPNGKTVWRQHPDVDVIHP